MFKVDEIHNPEAGDARVRARPHRIEQGLTGECGVHGERLGARLIRILVNDTRQQRVDAEKDADHIDGLPVCIRSDGEQRRVAPG